MSSEQDHTIELHEGVWLDLNQPIFFQSTDGKPGQARTLVKLRAQKEQLEVQFSCLDDPHWSSNTYTEHNTDLWRQEVFEIFIAAGTQVPHRYLELEINPNNAFFAAWVENHSGQGPEKLTMLTHEQHGIRHSVETAADHWKGSIHIPLALLGGDNSADYRLNFYRIVLRDKPANQSWECAPENCDFLCWQSTLSGDQPAFHRPKHFGSLRIATGQE